MALAFAVAAVVTGTASGKLIGRGDPQSGSEIPYLSHGQGIPEGSVGGVLPGVLQWDVPGGVTPMDLARAYEPRYDGVAQPDGYQPQLRGDEPLVIRDGPDGAVPRTPPSDVVSVAATSDGFDRDDVAIGFGLGLILAAACAAALLAARGRMRMAHS